MIYGERHASKVRLIAEEIKKAQRLPSGKKIRFYHGGTNSTRSQEYKQYYSVDISALNEVLAIDSGSRYALVEPNVPMDKLTEATLKYGLIPPVVPEFPGITCGGAVNGAALESSSFRHGQFNDSCDEYEIILGNGEVVKASRRENRDLFYGISGAYGTLGLVTLLKIKLIPASPYVHVRYHYLDSREAIIDYLAEEARKGQADFIEGIVFNPREGVAIMGRLSKGESLPVATYTNAANPWFYEGARKSMRTKEEREEAVPLKDFLFRYDRGAFWMGEHALSTLRIPSSRFIKFLLDPLLRTRKLYKSLHATNMSQEYFIQDFYVPIERSLKFLEYADRTLGIYPIWLCPVRSTSHPQKLSPHYIPRGSKLFVDVGLWGRTPKYAKDVILANRNFEVHSREIGARKMLYAHAYYAEDEFWEIYDQKWYELIRRKYRADQVFPDIWEKIRLVPEKQKTHFWRGALEAVADLLVGK